jgi:UDP-N-acetyl-D-galactosamine dehydrogenase
MNELLKNWNSRTIAVIGLGYVGLPLALEFSKKRMVIGYDINRNRIDELKAGIDRTRECQDDELKEAIHLTYTNSAEDLTQATIFIITVPTPIDQYNRPDLGPLVNASKSVAKVLKRGDCVIYESTVYPGCTEEDCVPVLERYSGLIFNQDFSCGYSPERINPGDKTHRLPLIKKVTSGSTSEIAEAIDSLYRDIIVAGTHKASSIKVAEAAKVIENAQRDINIAFVNELSIIFNKMQIDTTEVLQAAATKWNFLPFKPGFVGGHCIGVDPYYLTHKAQSLGYHPEVILSGRRINDNMGRYVAREVIRRMIKNGIEVTTARVNVFGITFKENCPDIRNSRVIDIILELTNWGVEVSVTDPVASANDVLEVYGLELITSVSPSDVDSLIVAVAHDEFRNMSTATLRALCCTQTRPVIADVKALYPASELRALGFDVLRL